MKRQQRILLLSSSTFIQDHPKVFEEPFSAMRIAYVTTASKSVPNMAYVERTREFFREQKCDFIELDLDGKSESELRGILSHCDAVYVEGGNSFYLLKSIRESGFESVIKELLPKGLIYMGVSAGSYVVCPTIEMALWKHQDKFDHHGVSDYTAMGLVPFLVTAHYKSEYNDVLKEKVEKTNYEVKILSDDQALVIIDNDIKLLGGEEIKLK